MTQVRHCDTVRALNKYNGKHSKRRVARRVEYLSSPLRSETLAARPGWRRVGRMRSWCRNQQAALEAGVDLRSHRRRCVSVGFGKEGRCGVLGCATPAQINPLENSKLLTR